MLKWLWAVKLKIEATLACAELACAELACAEFSAGAGLRQTNNYNNNLP